MNEQESLVRRSRIDALSYRVIGLCLDVHRGLGPGLLESVYEEALAYEFASNSISFARQCTMPVQYKGLTFDCGFRADFVVEQEIIVELKAVHEVTAVHLAQILTYLKVSQRSLGLLINFNVPVLKAGIRRIVAGTLFEPAPV